jgi:hydroxypyruvate isomerase
MNRRIFNRYSMAALLTPFLPGSMASASLAAAAPPDNGGHKFSVMLWTLPKGLTFEQQLDIAAAAGFDGVEVGNEYEKWTSEEWKRNLAKKHALNMRSIARCRDATRWQTFQADRSS